MIKVKHIYVYTDNLSSILMLKCFPICRTDDAAIATTMQRLNTASELNR
jgi:hypothetical protein